MISISLSPNIEKDDILLVLKIILQPWKWKRGSSIESIEKEFKKYLNSRYAFSFNSGRSSLMALLESLNLEKGGEILVQAFTCNAAVNPIIWLGLKPVYVDCDDSLNMDAEDIVNKITPKSRVLMVQHTFGLAADMERIVEICRKNNLIMIEDCAHSLGGEYNNRKIGTFGDLAFFSFSRDKVISSVYGGMAVVNNTSLGDKIKMFQEEAGYPSNFWIFQQLLHPLLLNFLILPFYSVFGKYLLVLFQWLNILSKAVHWKEKKGQKPSYFPKRMPNALALLALNQFCKLEKFNNHRKEIAQLYYLSLKDSAFELPQNNDNVFLRFAVKHSNAHQIIKKAWRNNILVGDWYTSPIAPDDTILERVGYSLGSCPNAEKLSKITLNLPTHINISKEQAKKIVDFVKKIDKIA